MSARKFVVIGENIHCTRGYRTDGALVAENAILYRDAEGRRCRLPVPEDIRAGDEWRSGKVRHCAVALGLALKPDAPDHAAGVDYLRALAVRQQAAGADFLDLNVDEYTAVPDERCRAMRGLIELLAPVACVPFSIDSSNLDVLEGALELCDRRYGPPLLNSVSLERAAAVELAARHGAAVIASAAGERELPQDVPQRLDNLKRLMTRLSGAGLAPGTIYIDPLVFPIATDSGNGRCFLDAVRAIRAAFGAAVHLVGGFSNVSFGMPARKLINLVFTRLALDAGADGGIVDPFQINRECLRQLDTQGESFVLARRLLEGDDPFGAEFIAAHREGRLSDPPA